MYRRPRRFQSQSVPAAAEERLGLARDELRKKHNLDLQQPVKPTPEPQHMMRVTMPALTVFAAAVVFADEQPGPVVPTPSAWNDTACQYSSPEAIPAAI